MSIVSTAEQDDRTFLGDRTFLAGWQPDSLAFEADDPFDDFDDDDFDDEFDDDFEENWDDDMPEDQEFPDTFEKDEEKIKTTPFRSDPDFDD